MDELKMKKLDKRIRTVWLFWGILFLIVLAGAGALVCVNVESTYRILAVSLSCAVFVLFALIAIGVPILRYRYYAYAYDEKRILIRKGIIFRSRIVIPICQIQDLHLFQGPVMMICHLHQVIISTAGSNFTINGLEQSVAKKMVEDLEERLNQRIEALNDESVQ